MLNPKWLVAVAYDPESRWYRAMKRRIDGTREEILGSIKDIVVGTNLEMDEWRVYKILLQEEWESIIEEWKELSKFNIKKHEVQNRE